MISGLNHITLSVRKAEESFHFYTEVLGLRPVAKWPKGSYLLAGDLWVALIEDDEIHPSVLPEYTHIAFTVSSENFAALSQAIQSSGMKIWQENKTEGESLYFTDPNGHKLEIHSSDLSTRIAVAKERPWDGLEFYV